MKAQYMKCKLTKIDKKNTVILRLLLLLWIYTAVEPVFSEKHYVFTPLDASQGLSGNKVRNISQLPDGRMMITTEGQINIYDGTSFTYLHYNKNNICRLSEYSGFNHTYVDNNGYVWVKNNYTLMIADITREEFLNCPDSIFREWGINTPLKDLFMDKYSDLWVITEKDDLLHISKDRKNTFIFKNKVSLDNDQIYDLGVIDDKLYLFYKSGMLICHDIVSGKELYRRNVPADLPKALYGNTSYVVQGHDSFYQLCNGTGGGIMLNFNIYKKNWEIVMNTDSWFNYLSIDRDGSIWVSGHDGLYNISPDLKEKQYIQTLKLVDGRKIDTEISTLYNDLQGGMWIGTLNRGILYYHPNRFRFQNIGKVMFSLPEETSMHVTGFEETENKDIIVKTDTENYLYSPKSGSISVYKGKVTTFKEEKIDHLNNKRILQTAKIGKDVLVGITRDGWFIYDKQNNKTDFHPTCHPCNCIYTAGSGKVWIGLEDGLMLLDVKTGKEHRFHTSDGLVNNSVRSIIQTPDSSVWISTANGISNMQANRNTADSLGYSFVNFNQYDGVITDEFCESSVYITSDNTIYWGGINGFNILNTSSAQTEEIPYLPLFVGFNLFGEKIHNGMYYHDKQILKNPITTTKEIVLRHDQNFFTIEFAAMNYINPTQTYYRYQLNGIDKTELEIHSTDGRGRATYTDLPPGNYTFKVRSTGNGKGWTDKYAELKIRVKAPFWKTGYAYTVYIILAGSCIAAFILLYIRKKKRSIIREQKEKLDEMKTTFIQNINQELEEPIKKIISPLDAVIMHMDEGRSKLQLQSIRQNATELQTLVKQLSKGALLPIPTDENNINLDVLIIEMRQLLEQQETRKKQINTINEKEEKQELLSETDEAFIRKVLKNVEQNLDNQEYSVETLSRDMGMDRTGLYRKLIALVGKTPTSFIRSVRLKRAAQLLEKGYTVAEVADSVGFSTSSYLCKCFQEEFGVRPSQYVQQLKKH